MSPDDRERLHTAVLLDPAGEHRAARKARRRAASEIETADRKAQQDWARAEWEAEREARRATTYLPPSGEARPAALRTPGVLGFVGVAGVLGQKCDDLIRGFGDVTILEQGLAQQFVLTLDAYALAAGDIQVSQDSVDRARVIFRKNAHRVAGGVFNARIAQVDHHMARVF